MARTQFNASIYDAKHFQNFPRLKKRLQSLYDKLYAEVAKAGAAAGWDGTGEFHLSDFPVCSNKIDRLLQGLTSEIHSMISDGVDDAWNLSYEKNSHMVEELAALYGLSKARVDEWSKRNIQGMEAFKNRRVNGMNLSERVWDFVKNDKMKMELALELGIAEGKSAAALSREVRNYLQEPNKLFRRVRGKDGVLRLSKAAQAYHPGRGVYRSSYKNALRMTWTENNIAYRTADHEAWQNMEFVTGQIIKLSNNHTLNGVPFVDICDKLKGEYPKGFKFTGWHPHCRCYVIAKMASREELNKYAQLSDQDQANYQFENVTRDVPKQFTDWIDENRERVQSAMNVPYFIKDNFVNGDITQKMLFQVEAAKPLTPLQIASMRHANRTQAEKDDIQARWDADRERVAAEMAANATRTREEILAAAEARHNARTIDQINDIKDRWALREDYMSYPAEQRAMFDEIEKALGIKRGFSMPYLRADRQSANPNYSKGRQYQINCQTCSATYQLRRWGFDVTANGNTEKQGNMSYYLSYKNRRKEAWFSPGTTSGKPYKSFNDWKDSKGYNRMTEKRYKEYFDDVCKNDGIYEIGVSWKGGGGHRTIIQRENGVIRYVEPQIDNNPQSDRYWDNLDNLCKKMTTTPHYFDGAMRVDDAIFNIGKFSPIFGKNASVPLHTQRVLNAAAERQAARTKAEVKDIKARWKRHKEERNVSVEIAKIKSATSISQLKDMRKKTRGLTDALLKDTSGRERLIREAFIQRTTELRHAARNAEAIQAANDARRNKARLALKQAENIAKVANKTPWIDAMEIAELNNPGYWANHINELQVKTREMVKQIQQINAEINKYETIIPNTDKWIKQFSRKDMQTAYAAVERTFNRWTWDLQTDSSLSFLKGRLEREIHIVETIGKKYNTWEIVKESYEKRLALVNKRISMKSIKDSISADISAAIASKNKVAARLTNEFESLFNDDNVDIALLKKAADKITAKVAQLNAKAQKAAAASLSAINGSMTDAEIEDKLKEYFKSIGETLKASDYKIVNGCVEITDYAHAKLAKGCNLTDAEKTQTWRHGSGGYIRTSRSFTINGAIRDVGGKGKHVILGDISKADVSKSKDMYGQMLSADDVKTIKALDSVIAKNALPFPIRVNRFVSADAVKSIFDIDISNSRKLYEAILKLPTKRMIPDPAFMSVSTDVTANVFTGRDFLLEIDIPQGHPIYVTSNVSESECVLGRATNLAFHSISVNKSGTYVIKCTAVK